MKVSKRTERLIREAAVMGFVQGAMWGAAHPRYMVAGARESGYPRDSQVVADVLRSAHDNSDHYPMLSKVDPRTPFLLPPQWLLDRRKQDFEDLRQMMRRMAASDRHQDADGDDRGQAAQLHDPGALERGHEGDHAGDA